MSKRDAVVIERSERLKKFAVGTIIVITKSSGSRIAAQKGKYDDWNTSTEWEGGTSSENIASWGKFKVIT